MKKIFKIVLIICLFFPNSLLANDIEAVDLKEKDSYTAENFEKEITLEENITDIEKDKEEFEKPILLEEEERFKEEEYNPYTKDALKAIIEKDYDLNCPDGMFKDQLTIRHKKGIIKEHTSEFMITPMFIETMDEKDSDLGFEFLPINFGQFINFRSEKEKFIFIGDLTPGVHKNFFKGLVLDAWVESTRIKNHKVKIGKFRPMVGYEGSRTNFLIPMWTKSQISRHFSNARKTGVSIQGKYKYLDYYLEGFNSDIQFEDFFPGAEGVVWLDFKPLANFEGKYGDLVLGGGFQGGTKHSTDYSVTSAGIKYAYKKFWLVGEYAYANGSNGTTGLTDAKRQGYNLTVAYRPTKKLELLARFDDFDNNTEIKNNSSREYTVGFNYFFLGQALRLICNYVYCQKDNAPDSHKLIFGTQIAL